MKYVPAQKYDSKWVVVVEDDAGNLVDLAVSTLHTTKEGCEAEIKERSRPMPLAPQAESIALLGAPMTKDEFELAFRRAMDNNGESYDPYDIAANWGGYQKDPSKYEWLTQEKP